MEISKRTTGKKKQHYVISISKEIVIEILRRVPCQDLTENLKKVCMEWCSIIYSGSFAYSQIEHRILKSSSSFSQMEAVVITLADDQNSVTVSSLEWHSNQNHSFQDLKTKELYTTKDVLVQTWLPMPLRRMIRVNSVNGFVCFWSTTEHSRFHIFNPVTKEHVTTPTNTYLGENMNDDPCAVGLGCCPLWYEYKVVVLDNAESGVIKPSIFTIGKDYLWRSLKEIPHYILEKVDTFAYVKGVLYWYTKTCTSTHYLTRRSKTTTKTLICFDVTKEEFDMIVVPFERRNKQVVTSIAEKGGRLCLVIISCGPICSLLIEVYVACNMNDLSSLNSWNKDLTVTAPSIAYNLELEEFVHIIIVTDEILVIQLEGRDVGFFDVATGKLLGLYSVPYHSTAIPYVPSLVALRHRPLLASSS